MVGEDSREDPGCGFTVAIQLVLDLKVEIVFFLGLQRGGREGGDGVGGAAVCELVLEALVC